MKKYLLILFLGCTVFSCSKSDKDPVDQQTEVETILQSHNWKNTSSKIGGAEVLGHCTKDDVWIFESTGVFKQLRGTLKCTVSEADFISTWSVSADGKMLDIAGVPAEIIFMSADKIEISTSSTVLVIEKI